MDPVSAGLLAALAGGAGGEIGRQTWAELSALVHRPLRRRDRERACAVSSGEAELVALTRAPGETARAQALSIALAVRAALEPEFGTALQAWHEEARLVRTTDGEVHNEISGGTFHGPVRQGRDFSGHTFTSAPTPRPAAEPHGPETRS
ncbi:hypothetical protein [Streptomyces shenzhenensis]|uniref:hypothetical protein n=1 Tax=Streptomyces shenzhenensis TaxID=943815 RepID=UPI0015F0F476|nr:hypothetical protein [Streptomyces shenzhenensis]